MLEGKKAVGVEYLRDGKPERARVTPDHARAAA